MNNRNKNNRIVFLTTLSVYLGLVLVGGALSPVLAQAALTRNFDIQEEIEVNDDLDKKPDDTKIEDFAESDFPALFSQLLSEIKSEIESGKFFAPIQTDFVIKANFSSGVCGSVRIGSDIDDDDFREFVANAVGKKFESKIFQMADSVGEKSKEAEIRIRADDSEWSFEVSFNKTNAASFAALLNEKFSLRFRSAENALNQQLYENTKSTAENNQVFIVTRLPRGSLDALLRQDAKAEK